MSDAAALIQAIREAPEDDLPRLAYADWLEEDGRRERGELIRIQCELARLAEDEDRRDFLQRRERELLVAHAAEWIGELGGLGCCACGFQRGFVECLNCDPAGFLELD